VLVVTPSLLSLPFLNPSTLLVAFYYLGPYQVVSKCRKVFLYPRGYPDIVEKVEFGVNGCKKRKATIWRGIFLCLYTVYCVELKVPILEQLLKTALLKRASEIWIPGNGCAN
jgi:hypothetical protein